MIPIVVTKVLLERGGYAWEYENYIVPGRQVAGHPL
jgi:hypothetical protein